MGRSNPLACAVVLALAVCTDAHAQNASHGQEIYQSICASCHGPAANDEHGIVTIGANNPAAILQAWQSRSEMRFLLSLYNAADRADIAAYLGAVKGGGSVTAAGTIQLSPTSLDFGALPLGVMGAARSVTVTGTSGSVAISAVASDNSAEFPVVGDTCTGTTLGVGATCHVDVAFTPNASGSRGATISIANDGSTNPVSFTAVGIGGIAAAVNYQGLWWGGAAENGWGLNFAHQGDVLFVTWYTYDATGKAAWLTMLASRTGPGIYGGPIVETHGSPYTATPYDPNAKQDTAVGNGTITFTSATAGTFSFTAKNVSRTLAISKVSLTGATPVCTYLATADLAAATNYQDIWWGGAAENGMGVNFAHDGDVIFATWFVYDVDGTPLWFVALLQRSVPNVYSGELDRASSAPFGAT